MGLPLFIAPVESDLPSRAADKATSPSRSGIRRHGRPDSRERRAAMRRQMSIRDRLTAPSHPSRTRSAVDVDRELALLRQDMLYEHAAAAAAASDQTPFREVLREMARTDDRQREHFEEQLHSLFTGNPLRGRDNATNADGPHIFSFADGPFPETTSNTRLPANTAPSREPNGVDSQARAHESGLLPLTRQPSLPLTTAAIYAATRRRRHDGSTISTPLNQGGGEERQNEALQRFQDVNGLGDRERSLSPEVWNTLLTTLTPDPQPPSAGSSFASTVASQSAGAPGTSPTTPEAAVIAAEAIVDQACESGRENSDTEDFDNDSRPETLRRRRRLQSEDRRRVRVRLPHFHLDAHIPSGEYFPTRQAGPVSGPHSRASEYGSGNMWMRDRSTTQREPESMVDTAGNRRPPFPPLRGSRHGWIGQLSVGTSDDEQGPEGRSLNRESSTVSGNAGDEDWDGMQRIVRRLAHREDIPDEWWAEAGLSRTLPRDGTD